MPLCTCLRRQDLLVREYPDGCVVYDEADASLHALEPWAAEALLRLMQGPPLEVAELANGLVGGSATADELALVEDALQQFAARGWVAWVPA